MSAIATKLQTAPATFSHGLNVILIMMLALSLLQSTSDAANLRYCEEAVPISAPTIIAQSGKIRQNPERSAVLLPMQITRQVALRETRLPADSQVSFIRCVPIVSNPAG